MPRAGALLYVADGQKIQNAKSAIRCSVLAGARRAKLAARQDQTVSKQSPLASRIANRGARLVDEKVGVDQPIVVDEQGVVIKGHGRLLAAHKAGFEEFPVVQHFGLAEEDKTAIRLADNQSSLLSEWNQEFLSEQLAELQLAGFDMALLGFDASALPGFTGDLGETVSLFGSFRHCAVFYFQRARRHLAGPQARVACARHSKRGRPRRELDRPKPARFVLSLDRNPLRQSSQDSNRGDGKRG